MDITDILEQYRLDKQNYQLSDKQKYFIKSLCDHIYPNQSVFDIVSDLMGKPISDWSDLSSKDVRILISKLINRKPITPSQTVMIQGSFTIDDINTKLRLDPPVSNYSDLNNWHVKRLLATVKKFNLRPVDHPLEATIDYEYGYQDSDLCKDNKMYYLKLYDLMMLDYDDIDYDHMLNILEPYLDDSCFRIYETHNGYHVFVMSRTFNYSDPSATRLMKQLQCDDYYVMFCHKNGYKIRLSYKLDRNETFLAKYLWTVGNEDLIDPECERLIKIHDKYISN